MPQRDPPLWARCVAVVLLLFATWWLYATGSVRGFIGESVGALCLGVIAISVLRGMHIPLGMWPNGPWRKRFSVPWVIGTAAVMGAILLISGSARSGVIVNQLDAGTFVTTALGTIGVGFGFGFVRHRRYLLWYAAALLLGILPIAVELLLGSYAGGVVALLPLVVFLAAVGVPSKLATEEIAFRRMLIGIAPGAGLASVLISAVAVLLWLVVLHHAGVGGAATIVMGALGALSAGCIYVLSGSLLASALFNALQGAGLLAVTLQSNMTVEQAGLSVVSAATWIAVLLTSAGLTALTLQRNGFKGNLGKVATENAARS